MIASDHALNRLEERGITLEQVKSTIEEAKEVINVRHGRKAAFKQFEDKYVVVPLRLREKDEIALNNLKVDKERLKRYGFSRI